MPSLPRNSITSSTPGPLTLGMLRHSCPRRRLSPGMPLQGRTQPTRTQQRQLPPRHRHRSPGGEGMEQQQPPMLMPRPRRIVTLMGAASRVSPACRGERRPAETAQEEAQLGRVGRGLVSQWGTRGILGVTRRPGESMGLWIHDVGVSGCICGSVDATASSNS